MVRLPDLRDGDLAGLVLLSLGDHNREDAVLHGSGDGILVDADREGEGAGELADGALRDPVLGLGLLGGGG